MRPAPTFAGFVAEGVLLQYALAPASLAPMP